MAVTSNTVFDDLCRLSKAIADLIGRNCEVVIHDYTKPNPPVVAIYNGSVSHRVIGSTESIYSPNISMADCKSIITDKAAYNTFVNTADGRVLKVTSLTFKGEGYNYVLGINYDITPLLAVSKLVDDSASESQEYCLQPTSEDELQHALFDTLRSLGKPALTLTKDDRRTIVRILLERGLLSRHKSVPIVAEGLGVSRGTIYNYINEIKRGEKE